MCCRIPLRLSIYAVLTISSGCRMGVPIHVWQPPQLQSTVDKRVVLSTVAGPSDLAGPLTRKLFAMTPNDAGRATTLVNASNLKDTAEIRLVSATDAEPNDVALASAARREGIDFVLRGEVIEDRYPSGSGEQDVKLKISWRLTSLGDQPTVMGSPVVVDVDSAIDRYPDLAFVGDVKQILTTAASRDTFRLITPSVERDRVQLAIPYMLPGSKEVRRGNAAAFAGRWGEAEIIWNAVAENHPTQIAATHNLALAAAAGQDFSRAKQLARKAIRRHPSALYKQTLVWIELKQKDYHNAFGLPDPPEGWFVIRTHHSASRGVGHSGRQQSAVNSR